MGYIRHNALIVIGDGYEEAYQKFNQVYEKAKELFGPLVTNVIHTEVNNYFSFMIAPDGSKEGWDLSDHYDEKRKQLSDYIDSLAYDDGSNAIQFADIALDECYEVEINRTNKDEGEVFE